MKVYKNKIKKYVIWLPVLALLVLCGLEAVRTQAASSTRELERITAFYTGGSIEVGKKIDPEKMYVTAYYKVYNGYTTTTTMERVTEGYTVLPDTISSAGNNTVIVMYNGKTTQVSVQGKTVDRISAIYTGDEVTVGGTFSTNLVEVTVFYSDGTRENTKDFIVESNVVTEKGLNTFPVIYGGKVSYIYVTGKEPLAVTEIMATYNGDDLIVGSYISKSDIEVWALYNNGDFVELTSFNISPATVEEEGNNEIEVSFGGQTDTIEIWGLRKEMESIRVKYTGPGVVVGTRVDPEDIEVIATYNDGSTAQTSAFTLSDTLIKDIGENIVVVFCDRFVEIAIVNGVEGFAPNFNNSISEYMFSHDYRFFSEVTLGMAEGLAKNSFRIEPLDELVARRVVQRVIPTEEYISFVIAYDDDEMITKFPMGVRVTLPYGYDPDKFGVYYTPNQKSIMAKLDGEFIDEERTIYEFIAYEPGAYVLVHEVANLLVQEIVIEEELKLNTGRNYSLKPIILPKTAENKDVEYWSSDESVATVSETGKIRTHEEGTCEIWIEAVDGSGVYAIVTIEVVDPRKR